MASVGRSSRYRFSEKGTTIFKPSAAPRWKIATRILRFLPSTEAARASQEGTAPIPAITTAEPRKKMRRVNIVVTSSGSRASPAPTMR